MKTLLILYTVSLLLILSPQIKAQNWNWSIGFSDGWINYHLKNDNTGNTYFCFSIFGLVSPVDIETNGVDNIFIGKADDLGQLGWYKSIGGYNPLFDPYGEPYAYREYINSLILDQDNEHIYVSGMFYDSVFIDGFTLIATTETKHQGFIMKLDFEGNIIWAIEQPAEITGLAYDGVGNLYACGFSDTSFVFNTGTIAAGGYLAMYDTDGNGIWALNKFTNNGEHFDFKPESLKLDADEIFLNGYTDNDTVRVDTITRYVEEGSSWSGLACFNLSGDVKWLSLYGGLSSRCGNEFSLDEYSNTYTTGCYTGTGYFGADLVVSNPSKIHFYLTKHNPSGEIQWVKHIDATRSEGYYVSNVVDSSLYVTGYFWDTAYFDNDTISPETFGGMFAANITLDGSFQFERYIDRPIGYAISQDNEKNAYCLFNGNNYTVGDSVYPNSTNCLAKLSYSGSSIDELLKSGESGNLLTIYANPNSGVCNITIPEEFENEKKLTLYIYDLQGRLVQESKIELLEDNIRVNIQSQAKGVYNAILSNGKKVYRGKIVFE